MKPETISLRAAGREIPIRFANANVEWAAAEIASTIGERRPKLFVISDERVSLLYGTAFGNALLRSGFEVHSATFPPGEAHKSMRTAERLLDQLAEAKFARDDLLIGLGGGVATDIAGFVASIYQRGLNWFAVSTSLMGMVDAAIGGKTGVDHPLGKNLIGSFHQPLSVLAPLESLTTLPAREWVSGSAEIVKSALISGGEFWLRLQNRGLKPREWSATELRGMIVWSARTKAEIVALDEHEAGVRRHLNLGHTLGHAIETATHYSVYRHGEAILLGLRAAIRLSNRHGLLADSLYGELDELLATAPVPVAELDRDLLLEALSRDKKVAAGRVQWVLLREPGKIVVTDDVPSRMIHETIDWLCETARSGVRMEQEQRVPAILVINGPNLNLLGSREPEIYGSQTLDELEQFCIKTGAERGANVICRQSNNESQLVSLIQNARHWADGIVLNPGGYTHTSVAIRDAISSARVPTVEVHLSDIAQREEFRRTSLIADVCLSSIVGKGHDGYGEAIRLLVERIVTPATSPQ